MVDINKFINLNQEESELETPNDMPAGLLNSATQPETEQAGDAVQPDYRTKNQKSMDGFLYALPNSIIGGIAEVAESLPGVDEEDAKGLVETLTTDGMYRDFEEKSDGYKLTGSLAVSLVPILGMQKLMRSKSLYDKMEKVLGTKVPKYILPSRLSSEERINQFRQKSAAYVKKQGNTISVETTPELSVMMKQASGNAALDMFKIGVATDLGIYSLVGTNDFLFPDEMSGIETAAMYGVPNLVFSGAAGLIMRHKLKNVIRDVGKFGGEARNVAGLPLEEVFARPGERSNIVVVNAAQAAIKEKELANSVGDAVFSKNLNSQRNAHDAIVFDQVNKIAEDNVLPGITSKHTMAADELETVLSSTKNDFSTMYDVVSIEKYSPQSAENFGKNIAKKTLELKDTKAELWDKIKKIPKTEQNLDKIKRLKTEMQALNKQSDDLSLYTAVKLNTDGSMSLSNNVKSTFEDTRTGIARQSVVQNLPNAVDKSSYGDIVKIIKPDTKEVTGYSAKFTQMDASVFGLVETDFKPFLYKNGIKEPLSSLNLRKGSFTAKTTMQSLMRQNIKNYEPGVSPAINLTNQSTHLELDAAIALGEKFGVDNPALRANIKINDVALQSWNDVEFMSLSKKYNDWTHGVEQIGKQANDFLKFGKEQTKTLDDLIVELNLPNNGVAGMHPLLEVFSDLHKAGIDNLADHYPNLEVLRKGIEKNVLPRGDLEGKFLNKAKIDFMGNQFKTYDKPRKPVLLITKDSGVNPFNREELIDATTRQRMALIDGLKASGERSPLLAAMTEATLRDPNRLKTAQSVDSLIEGSQAHSDRFTQSMFGLSNQPAIIAADSIANEMDNLIKGYITKQFAPHNLTFNKILSHNQKADLNLFNIAVHQQGVGWRGTTKLTEVLEGGKLVGYKIPLEDHVKNTAMLEEAYGVAKADQKGMDFIPAPSFGKSAQYEPLVITPLAAESMLAINKISQDVLTHINELRKLSGLKEISRKELHMIPKNIADKEKIFLLDSQTGNVHTIASGNTPIQAAQIAKEEIENAKAKGLQLFEATEKDLQNYNLVKLDDFTRMVDFSTSFKQTGPAKGTSFGGVIETGPEVLKRQQEALINQYTTVGRVTSAMLFEPQLKAAELAATTSGLGTATIKKGNTIWDAWTRRTLGQKSGNEKQTIGKFYGSVEDVYDKILQKVWDQKVSLLKGGQSVAQAEKEWKGLDKALPGYNPFKDSVEYMNNTMQIKPPHNMMKHAGKLNAIAGATMLRMFELGLAAVNIMTLPTLIPVVAGALKRKPGQSVEEWKALNAAWGSTVNDTTALWNPYRATVTGTHFFFTEEGRNVIKLAGEKGHLWQKTVEQMQLFTSPSKGYTERMITKAVDFTSIAVDKTEEWSRGLSYATFYKLGKDNMGLKQDAAMEFAHQMANRVIGDFRPNNRPQIFQGAAGMPFGLFTTFAWNYLQRVFGYVEKSQFRDFFRQQGLQAAFFGAKSLPGFNQYVDNFTSNYDGTENMVDRLQATYGSEATDAMLFGSVGTASGIAAYTRTDIRLPGSNYLRDYSIADMAPAAGMIKKTYGGVSEFIKSLSANEGLNAQQISEITARTFPIKAIRGWVEIANGQSVDSRGQIVNEELRNATGIAGKMLSMKPLREQLVIEEMARIRATSLKRGAARKEFKLALRSSFRSGSLDGDRLEAIVKQYGKSTGGDYDNLKQTLRNEMEFALINKGYLQALKDSSNISNRDGMLRMIDHLEQ